MSKNKLDETSMLSELSESAFFRDRTPVRRESAHAPKVAMSQETKAESAQAPLDLSKKAVEKRGYRVTKEELWAIEDVKTEINRELGLGISQEDIVRSGIHFIVEDYRRHKHDSFLVKKVTNKRTG